MKNLLRNQKSETKWQLTYILKKFEINNGVWTRFWFTIDSMMSIKSTSLICSIVFDSSCLLDGVSFVVAFEFVARSTKKWFVMKLKNIDWFLVIYFLAIGICNILIIISYFFAKNMEIKKFQMTNSFLVCSNRLSINWIVCSNICLSLEHM